MAYALLILGVRYLAAAATRFAGPGLASILGWVETGSALGIIGFILPIVVWKARNLSRKDGHLYKGADGFVADTIARAQSASWVALFLTLVITEPLAHRIDGLSAGLLLEGVIAVMVISFAGAFLFLDREPTEDPTDLADA